MGKYIPNEILTSFTKFYEKEDVWQIHSGDSWLTVFLYKESQIEQNQDLPKYIEMKEGYLKLVKKYLDPPVSEIDEIQLSFDSKENFENKYQGNWYDYYH
jgi:hypothetical protein